MTPYDCIRHRLLTLYGPERGAVAFGHITSRLKRFQPRPSQRESFFDQGDVVLITYGDTLVRPSEAPLKTLANFACTHLSSAISAIHLLPFYPFSADDGFSIVDFMAVDPHLGRWQDIEALGDHFGLMFDFVLNHISSQSPWFHSYLAQENGFEELAIEVPPDTDLSDVVRPRALPLLTPVTPKNKAPVSVWTTFSADQIDLNYQDPKILEKMVAVLLNYLDWGASMIRLDAVAYLWKSIGTSCIHLPQTHEVVRLLRDILDAVAPDVLLITETNVPHKENISYFGNGRDEAQLVYNFTLPPLLLDALLRADSRDLTAWVQTLSAPSRHTTFFNFTASHDGIGVRPLEGILSAEKIAHLLAAVRQRGGKVSSKANSDGSLSPYEMNISYVDALGDSNANPSSHIARVLASQAIAMALPGMPALYIHTLLGSRNWQEGVRLTGRARSINREKLSHDPLIRQIADRNSFRARIFFPLRRMLTIRRQQPAFHPHAASETLSLGKAIFGLARHGQGQTIWALTNLTAQAQVADISGFSGRIALFDLLEAQKMQARQVYLKPYATVWLCEK